MHHGPWDFKGFALLLAEYGGFTNPKKVKLDRLETWCQIHKLPNGAFKNKLFLENIAKRIGEVQEVHITLPNGFVGEFIRIKVRLGVNKKLTRFVMLAGRWGIHTRNLTKQNLNGPLQRWCPRCQ